MTGAVPAATDSATDRLSRLPVLLSVNVGLPKNVTWQGKTVMPADPIAITPSVGPVPSIYLPPAATRVPRGRVAGTSDRRNHA